MFEVKLTIEPHEDGVHCGPCEWQIEDRGLMGCKFYDDDIEPEEDDDEENGRCPACLEAERKWKEDSDV